MKLAAEVERKRPGQHPPQRAVEAACMQPAAHQSPRVPSVKSVGAGSPESQGNGALNPRMRKVQLEASPSVGARV